MNIIIPASVAEAIAIQQEMRHEVGRRRHLAHSRRLEQALHEAAVGLLELERRLAHVCAFLSWPSTR